METSLTLWLIGSSIVAILIIYFRNRARRFQPNRDLQFGWGTAVLGAFLLVPFGIFPLILIVVVIDAMTSGEGFSQLTSSSICLLILCFPSVCGASLLAEFFFSKGHFDTNEIIYRDVWAGRMRQHWEDLEDVDYNEFMGWYVFTFRTGPKIRLSRLLSGHKAILKMLQKKGFPIESGAS